MQRSSRRLAAIVVVSLAACSSGTSSPPASSTTVAVNVVASSTEPVSSVSESTPDSLAYDLPLGDECGTAADLSTEPGEPITLWSSLPPDPAGALATMVAAFEATTGRRVSTRTFSRPAEAIDELRRSSAPPDLVTVDLDGFLPLAASGLATDVQSCIDTDPAFDPADLVPSIAGTYSIAGRVVAMPLIVSSPVLIYDKKMMASAGLDPNQPPADLAGLRTTLEAMARTGLTPRGLLLVNRPWYVTAWSAQRGEPIAAPDNGRRTPARAITLTGTSVADDLAYLRSLVDDGLAQWADDSDPVADLRALIDPAGRAAMTVHTSGSLGGLYDIAEQAGPDGPEVGVGPMPGPGSGGLVGGQSLMMLGRDPGRLQRAWSLVSWLTAGPQQARFSTAGYVPVRRSSAALPEQLAIWQERPGLRVAYDVLLATPDEPTRLAPIVGLTWHMNFRLNWAVEDVVKSADGGREPVDALADAERDMNRVLQAFHEVTGA